MRCFLDRRDILLCKDDEGDFDEAAVAVADDAPDAIGPVAAPSRVQKGFF